MCCGCMNDDYVHAKRNGTAVPLSSRRPKDGKTSHKLFVINKVLLTDRTVIQSMTFENDRALHQSEDE